MKQALWETRCFPAMRPRMVYSGLAQQDSHKKLQHLQEEFDLIYI